VEKHGDAVEGGSDIRFEVCRAGVEGGPEGGERVAGHAVSKAPVRENAWPRGIEIP